VDQCWKEIDKQIEEAVKSYAFATIERFLLEVVVERDTEVKLFKAVIQWAKRESGKQGLVADWSSKKKKFSERRS